MLIKEKRLSKSFINKSTLLIELSIFFLISLEVIILIKLFLFKVEFFFKYNSRYYLNFLIIFFANL